MIRFLGFQSIHDYMHILIGNGLSNELRRQFEVKYFNIYIYFWHCGCLFTTSFLIISKHVVSVRQRAIITDIEPVDILHPMVFLNLTLNHTIVGSFYLTDKWFDIAYAAHIVS